MTKMFGTDKASIADMSPVSATGIDEELILGSNFNNELVRMNTLLNKHNQIPLQNRDNEWEEVEGLIKSNIDMLSEAKKMAELQQNQMTDTSRESFEKGFMRNIVAAGQLKGDFDVSGNYEAKGVKQEIYGKAVAAVASMGNLAQLARNNGYVGIDDNGNKYDPIEFIKIFGSAAMKKIILVTPDDGEPYLSVGEDIFDEATRQSPAWLQSIIQDSASTTPPPVGGASGTGTITGASSSGIPNSLLTNVQSTTPSTRKAAAKAIMTRIKRANQGKTQAEYEAEFKRITGLEYSVASS